MTVTRMVTVALVAVWMLPASACAEAPASQITTGTAVEPTDSPVVAEVGDRRITLAEVDETALMADVAAFGGLKLNQAMYESRSRTLDGLVADYLIEFESTERGISTDELIKIEIADTIAPVQDAEVEAWFNANRGRVGGRTIDQVREPIRGLLGEQRQKAALEAFVSSMREKVSVRITLDPPRVNIQVAANDPSYGPEDAPVQIVEFSDFQ